MSKKIIVNSGEIFCIPLFMDKEDWKLKVKLSENDLDKDEFAFGRVIETSSSVLVEIFGKIGSAKIDMNEIVNSGIMFSPIQIFWDAIIKKRWKIIGQTENYNKFTHSNYGSLKMAFGTGTDGNGTEFRLRDLGTEQETFISREEVDNYQFSVVWFPIDLENRILESLNIDTKMPNG